MQNFFKIFAAIIFSFLFSESIFAQGTTTSMLEGKVTDGLKELSGANIVALNLPTGFQYGTTSNMDGYFRIPNMKVGGPYKITVSYIGYRNFEQDELYLNLGQMLNLKIELVQIAIELDEVVVTAIRNDLFDGNRTGAETAIDIDHIKNMPNVARNLTDFARLTPQANTGDNNLISIAGMNTRYNAISIDGAINHDVFGLSGNATNGGQTGGTPISIDAIEQFQIAVAPFDVRQNGFNGANINMITRSGTNEFHGSIYQIGRNESFAGKTPGSIKLPEGYSREKLPAFDAKIYGARIGGPIIQNKLLFFTSFEIQRDETPQPFHFSNYQGPSSEAQINAIAEKLKTDYGYDPGGFLNNVRKLNSDKFLGRIDWNINDKHKLKFRHSYTKNEATMPNASNSWSINFNNSGVLYPSTTNSTALELNSNYIGMSNNLLIGYTNVRENRNPMGEDFPGIRITDGWTTIIAGSELYSTADKLKQDILTITDNFSLYRGKHTLTFGTNNEIYSMYNLSIYKNFGEYSYNSVDDFMNDAVPSRYERRYSLIDNVSGDNSKAAAEFNMIQLGVYAQDEYQMNDKLKLKFGIRLDIPFFLENPKSDTYFNSTTISKIEDAGYDLNGAKSGEMPKTQFLFSPRFGFNYDVKGNKTTQIRGGVGVFTSRLPLVWPAGSYVNNGLTIGSISQGNPTFANGSDFNFNPDPNTQPTIEDLGGGPSIPSGQVDIFADNFKFPQILRTSMAVDQKLPWDLIGTLEFMYSKTLNNINYKNLNILPATQYLTGQDGADTRPLYFWGRVDPTYSDIMLGINTNKGYAYNFTTQLQKPFDNGLTACIAYALGHAKAINDGKAYQNSWQWTFMEHVNGRNFPDLDYSVFDLGSRISGYLSYNFNVFKRTGTTISLFYNGQSGRRFSYTYAWGQSMIQEVWNSSNALIYVPASEDEINLVDIGTPGNYDYVSAHDQWIQLDEFISEDDYLNSRRGKYAERNGARLPFEHIFDVKIIQDFYLNAGGKRHTFQITFDIFNFANLLNKDWGRRTYTSSAPGNIINFVGFENDGTTPIFTFQKPRGDLYNIDDSGINSSRWQAQFGIRYLF
ncbi:MAG: TonB-dependent receptor [Deferribacteres bacterium]|nr:TonB-dependent receptor [Deferribacteres bacterium]